MNDDARRERRDGPVTREKTTWSRGRLLRSVLAYVVVLGGFVAAAAAQSIGVGLLLAWAGFVFALRYQPINNRAAEVTEDLNRTT